MLHLIVGNTGSGKTSYSNSLKKQNGGVIFSIDHWNKVLFLKDKNENDGLEWMLERIERSENMIMDLIEQLESSNSDAILDLGFSKFEHREKFRKFAIENGFSATVHLLDVPKEIRWERVQKRNRMKGETFSFEVGKEDFDFMETWFEKPNENEMEHGILISDSN